MSKSTLLHLGIILSVSATIFLTSLGKARLWDRDEPRNAGCAAEMMNRGDMIVPMFNDELRHQKPVLLYWAMMATYSIFGVSEFAARLPSALFGLGSVLLTYGIARRLFDMTTALLAAVALSSSIMFCVAARAATPDSILIFFSTLGIYFYVIGTFLPSEDGSIVLRNKEHWFPQQIGYVVAMNVAFAFAVLAKGPVGLVLPTAIIGMYLLIQRLEPLPVENKQIDGRLSRSVQSILRIINPIHFLKTCWYMRPFTAIGIVLLIAAPWYVAVGMKTGGDFTSLFFLNENFARATTVMESHSGSWLFYPATIAVGFFPWSIFLAPILFAVDQQVSQRTKHAPAITLLACWVCVQVGLFSIAETKLPSYVTPCYPALSILAAFCLLTWIPAVNVRGIRWQYTSLGVFILAGLLTTVGLAIGASKYFPEIWWIAALGLIPIVGGSIAVYFLKTNRYQQVLFTTAASSVLFCLFMFPVGTVAVDATRSTHIVLNEVKSAAPETAVATYHCLESSWVFYIDRPIYELHRGDRTEATPNTLEREAFWKKKPVVSPEDFVAAHPKSMIITTDEHAEELLSRLPGEFSISTKTDFFLKNDQQLVLISNAANRIPETAASTQTTTR